MKFFWPLCLLLLTLSPRLALAKCEGGFCKTCVDCSRCYHCKGGGTCSVCAPTSRGGSGAPSTTIQRELNATLNKQHPQGQRRIVIQQSFTRIATPRGIGGANNVRPVQRRPSNPQYLPLENPTEPSWVRQQRLEREAGVGIPLSPWTGKCVLVADGDTLQILRDGVAQTVRLNGIDAPELKQSFGAQSKSALAGLVSGQNLKIYPTKLDNKARVR